MTITNFVVFILAFLPTYFVAMRQNKRKAERDEIKKIESQKRRQDIVNVEMANIIASFLRKTNNNTMGDKK